MEVNIWFDIDEDLINAETEKLFNEWKLTQGKYYPKNGYSAAEIKQNLEETKKKFFRIEVIQRLNQIHLLEQVTGKKMK